jgi:hypothetical protein
MTTPNARHGGAAEEPITEITVRFRDAGGKLVEITLDRSFAEREQLVAIVRRASGRTGMPGSGPAEAAPHKIRGCDDGELFRSWAMPG